MEKSIHTAEYQPLGALPWQLRIDASSTQVQVAERLSEPQSFVSKYESGERWLDVIELKHLLDALGASMVDFAEKIGSAD